MKHLLVSLSSFLILNTCACSTWVAAEILDASEFGLSSLAAEEDATPVFRKALEACRERKVQGLRIPPGTWHLYPDYAFEKKLAVANNNPGDKRVVFLLDDLEGFTLQGQNAHFICHGPMIPVSADNSRDLKLTGFSIDWERPFNFQGKVVDVHPDQNAFDVLVHDEVIYEIRNGRLIFREKPSGSPLAWKDWAPPPTPLMAWEHNLQWNMWFDGTTKHPIPGEHLCALEPDPQVEEIRPSVIRIFNAVNTLPQTGWVLTVKGMMQPNRTSPAIRIANSKNLLLEDITIHHAGGMGIIMQRTEGATLRRVNVSLPSDSARLVTTTADATHFNGCQGDILLEDCLFENMLDDATNIHGCFVRIEKQSGSHSLICRRVHSQQRGLIVMEAGDRVGFVTSANLQGYAEATVVSTNEINSDMFQVTLDAIPDKTLLEGSALYNLTWQPNFVMRHCLVRNHRGRTMLLATAEKVVIENNQFEYSSMAGIQFEGDNLFWWESGPVRDVVIRNNLFRNNAGAVLRIAPQIDAVRFPQALYHGGILFENNVIETFHRQIVEGLAIDGLQFRSNKILLSDAVEESENQPPSFSFSSGRNIVITGNTFNGKQPLNVKASTPSAIPTLRDNHGIGTKEEAIGSN